MDDITSAQIRLVIKRLLKKRGSTYTDLAAVLGLTVPAVKRLMTKGDFTINRIERISHWFGLTLFEFISITKDTTVYPYMFSVEAEATLVKNPSAFYLLLLLGAGLPLAEAQERAQCSHSKLMKDLFTLDKIKAIELGADNKVRILARGPYKWNPKGPLQRKYFEAYLKKISSLVTENPSADSLQIPFELYVSDRILTQMQTELRNVFEKYRSLSRIDHEISHFQELKPVSGLLLVKPFDTWKSLLI